MKFYLIHPKEIRSSIFADINYRKLRLRTATGIVINSKNWDQKNEKVISKEDNYSKINSKLSYLRGSIDSLIGNLKLLNKSITLPEFKSKIDTIINPDKKQEFIIADNTDQTPLIELLEGWKDNLKVIGQLRQSTIEKYHYFCLHVKDFEKATNKKLYLIDINDDFYDDYVRYLRVKKNLVNNTISVDIKCLKSFLNSLVEQGVVVNPAYKKFQTLNERRTSTIAFTEEDVRSIEKVDLTSHPKIEIVRDIFFVQLQSLQRVSDLFELRLEHFNMKDRTISITQRKTNNKVVIGLTKKIEEIFTKYNYKLPKLTRRQYNDRLKTLCKLADIDYDVEIVRKQGNSMKRIVKAKHELVSSHAIRRTGITHLLRKGVNPDFVMKIAGIKSYFVFQGYKKFAENEAQEAIKNYWDSAE